MALHALLNTNGLSYPNRMASILWSLAKDSQMQEQQSDSKAAPIEPLAVSVTRAAQLLGIGRTITYELIKCGKLQTANIGRRNMVRMSSIKRLVEGAA